MNGRAAGYGGEAGPAVSPVGRADNSRTDSGKSLKNVRLFRPVGLLTHVTTWRVVGRRREGVRFGHGPGGCRSHRAARRRQCAFRTTIVTGVTDRNSSIRRGQNAGSIWSAIAMKFLGPGLASLFLLTPGMSLAQSRTERWARIASPGNAVSRLQVSTSPAGETVLVATTSQGTFCRKDGSWLLIPLPTDCSLQSPIVVAPSDARFMYVSCFSSRPSQDFETHDAGNTWSERPAGHHIWLVDPVVPDRVHSVTESKCVLLSFVPPNSCVDDSQVSLDGGMTWRSIMMDRDHIVWSVGTSAERPSWTFGFVGQLPWAQGSGDGILRSTDSGGTWARVDSGAAANGTFYSGAVSPIDANLVYASGTGLFKSTDGGQNWSLANSEGVRVLVFARDGSESGGVTVYGLQTGNGETIVRWQEDTGLWVPFSDGLSGDVLSLSASPDLTELYVDGGRYELFHRRVAPPYSEANPRPALPPAPINAADR